MTLEESFYVLAIICMSISLLILVILVGAVVAIRNKLTHIHDVVEEKLSFATVATDVAKKVMSRKK